MWNWFDCFVFDEFKCKYTNKWMKWSTELGLNQVRWAALYAVKLWKMNTEPCLWSLSNKLEENPMVRWWTYFPENNGGMKSHYWQNLCPIRGRGRRGRASGRGGGRGHSGGFSMRAVSPVVPSQRCIETSIPVAERASPSQEGRSTSTRQMCAICCEEIEVRNAHGI